MINLRRPGTPQRRRTGLALVIVLICLGVMSSMLMSLAQATRLGQRQIDNWQWQEQAHWLIEAGAQQAALALAQQSDYRGETWRMTVIGDPPPETNEDSTGARPTVAELTVAVGEPESTGYPLRIVVRYPLAADHPVQITRQFWLPAENATP